MNLPVRSTFNTRLKSASEVHDSYFKRTSCNVNNVNGSQWVIPLCERTDLLSEYTYIAIAWQGYNG